MATSAGATRAADTITFAHNSERQFARLLDFYRVEWEYEPTAFPIEWDATGHAVQHFRPDFYLPRFGLYIEITTLNQRLVTKKNRKVRRLRELYPDVRIKVLYQRDYLSLLAKYGLEPPSQMLDPTEGTGPAGEGKSAPAGEDTATRAAEAGEPSSGRRRPARPAPGGSGGPESGGQGSGRQGSGGSADRRRTPERSGGTPGQAGGTPGQAGRRPGRAGGASGQTGGTPGQASEASGHAGGTPGRAGGTPGHAGGAVERARAAGRPRVVPDPPGPVPPLPADPALVRLAQVLLPAERAHRRGPAIAKRAG
jgi:hypothetical protein